MLMNYDFSFSPVNLSSVNIIRSAIELKRGRGNPLPPVFMVSYIYHCFFFFFTYKSLCHTWETHAGPQVSSHL